jgi:hypothetical protein
VRHRTELIWTGSSDFCGLFTQAEWEGFEYTLDLEYVSTYFIDILGLANGQVSIMIMVSERHTICVSC